MKHQIIRSIAAHGLWKARLKNSIDSGRIEMNIETAKKDDACEFGQWLYSENVKLFSEDFHYQRVRSLHADFHKYVGKVLEYIEQDNITAAKAMMSSQGEYTITSQHLVEELMNWSNQLGGSNVTHT